VGAFLDCEEQGFFFHICSETKLATYNITMKQNISSFIHIMDVK
jgi:hypothetical protein